MGPLRLFLWRTVSKLVTLLFLTHSDFLSTIFHASFTVLQLMFTAYVSFLNKGGQTGMPSYRENFLSFS